MHFGNVVKPYSLGLSYPTGPQQSFNVLKNKLAETKRHYLEKADSLDPAFQELFQLEVIDGIDWLIKKIDRIIAEPYTYHADILADLQRDYNRIKDQFETSHASYMQTKEDTDNQYSLLRDKVSNAIGADFSAFAKPKAEKDFSQVFTKFARCVKATMDPESPFGAMPCLAHHSKELSEDEKKRLSDLEPNVVLGKAIGEVAVVPVAISKVVNGVIGAVVKGFAVSALSEACVTADPSNYDGCMKKMRGALNGEDSKFNEAMKNATPACGLSASAAMTRLEKRLDDIDKDAQKKYGTIPGIVKNGMIGMGELGVGATVGLVAIGTVRLIQASGRGIQASVQAITRTSGVAEQVASKNTVKPLVKDSINFVIEKDLVTIKNSANKIIKPSISSEDISRAALKAILYEEKKVAKKKAIKKIRRADAKKFVIKPDDVTILKPANQALPIQESPFFKSRIVKEQTPLLPEDLGLNPDLFRDVKQFRELKGWIEVKDDALRVRISNIYMTDKTLGPLEKAMGSLRNIARTNNVDNLEIVARITNERLKEVMMKRYQSYLRNDSLLDAGWNLFRMPVETAAEAISSSISKSSVKFFKGESGAMRSPIGEKPSSISNASTQLPKS